MSFLGIRVPTEVGRLLRSLEVPGEKEAPSEYHITILHFENNMPIKQILKATETAYEIVSETEPFPVKTSKVAHFPPREGHPVPIVAPVKSEELHELHKKLSKAFDKAKIDFNKTFKEYNPHITLAYSEKEHEDYRMDTAVEFTVNDVVLWGGDDGDSRLFTTFQLKAPERKKRGALLNMVDVFERLTIYS